VELTAAEIRRAVRTAPAEDLGSGDVTTLATVPASAKSRPRMNAHEPLVVAGLL
jgi:nicotinate-nucleotide pyrophosphorylase